MAEEEGASSSQSSQSSQVEATAALPKSSEAAVADAAVAAPGEKKVKKKWKPRWKKKKKKKPVDDERAPTPGKKRRRADEAEDEDEAQAQDDDNDEAAGALEETDEHGNKYTQNIVFAGQLPFTATTVDVREHFAKHGVFNCKVRLLTDKKTKRSRGIAFVQVSSTKDMVAALRVHHTRLTGKMINVERTCGGGGNNEKRKAKIEHLRGMQGKKVSKEVTAKIQELLAMNPACEVRMDDFDERAIEALGSFPRDVMEGIVTDFMQGSMVDKDSKAVENRSAWLMGSIKRHRVALQSSDDFKGSKSSDSDNRQQKRQQYSHQDKRPRHRRPEIVHDPSANQW